MIENMMSGSMLWHHYTYMYVFPTIIGLLILAGIVYLMYWLFAQRGEISLKSQSALEVLQMRYARGEITEQQFRKMRKRLQ